LLALGGLFPFSLLAFDSAQLLQAIKDRSCPSCDLKGADLEGLDLSQGDFSRTDFTFANLRGTNLSGANCKQATFGYDFFSPSPAQQGKTAQTLADQALSQARRGDLGVGLLADSLIVLWDNSYLKTVGFKGTHLEKANFAGANLEGAYLVAVNLGGANFEGARLQGADFSYSILGNSNFSNAGLGQAIFYKSDLNNAYFGDADLTGAMLYKSNLKNVKDKAMTSFKGAKLGGAVYVEGQLCKAGSLGSCVTP
ncbi:MAG: hypothetical protein A2600_13685, partial [Candidatus Lambdaproteobacteria bacterium RIFOXYD1_FULL_56_27]